MPYILNTEKDIKEMLEAIGAANFEDLFKHLPREILLKEPLRISSGKDEQETRKIVESLARKNLPLGRFNSFLGAGCYDHYIPAALSYLIGRAEFLTAYTPYQAESSQGSLQTIYEYQSYMCLLTGMDVSNASLFDGASALAESALMSLRITKKKKVIVSSSMHPEYLRVLETYLSGLDFIIKEIPFDAAGLIDIEAFKRALSDDTACLALQSPNFFGLVEDVKMLSALTKQKNALVIMVTNPMSLAILKEPYKCGVDIVCGDGQALGGNVNFGGPSFGFLATRNEFMRQMPGRIVGKTVDCQGKPAYCLTLCAREQHIRREKATSNICSNQSLNAMAAAIYLALMGKEGIKEAALHSMNLAHYLYESLSKINGVKVIFSNTFFNEFIWQVEDAKKIIRKLRKKNIIAGFYMGDAYREFRDCILSCCTEKKSKEDIDDFIAALKGVLNG
ncbi:MAG: aminomethyl-transferring glycine dehydrogenase subunit GcvPA [Candidatus Omnitrophica bacterium]|nr:aminomethyl-transferring glycine dehydrogenase subunit GcvPA [Candidatus Omnitrophota bacterium]